MVLRRLIMDSTVNVTEAQAQFPKLLRGLRQAGAITVHRRGKIAAFIISPERMEAIIETLELLGNPNAMKAVADYEAGKTRMKDLSCLDEK